MSASIHVQVLATNHSHCRDGEQYVNGTYISWWCFKNTTNHSHCRDDEHLIGCYKDVRFKFYFWSGFHLLLSIIPAYPASPSVLNAMDIWDGVMVKECSLTIYIHLLILSHKPRNLAQGYCTFN